MRNPLTAAALTYFLHVNVTQVLDGYFYRADNSVNLEFYR
jgi:hypothetical protein